MTTERVDNLEKKIELGLSGGAHQRETCAMRNGHCCSRKSRVMDRVMQKFSEECKRKINVEDTHTIHSYELFNALQQVLHGVDAVEGVQLRVPWRTKCKRRASTWISTRLELKGW